MNRAELFSIGDVAKLFHISVSSLRHYEQAGLLSPEWTDPATGYRYYSTRQFEVLNTIRYLRALDMPLSQIGDFLKNRDVDRIEEKLRLQKQAVIQKQLELQRIEQKIDNRLRQLHTARTCELGVIELVRAPQTRIVWIDAPMKIHGFLDMEIPIRQLDKSGTEGLVFLGKVGVGISAEHLVLGEFTHYDGVFLVLEDDDRYEGSTLTLPETACARIRFRGSHTEAPAQYAKLISFIQERKMNIAGFSREITMIDYGITGDTDKFVTEIQIPVSQN